ncbi:MAG TPA: hypothetical protein VIQ81_01050 [Gammaproteobacteria bacterium]
MKKIILSAILLIIVAIAGGVYYVLTNLDSLVEQAIETYGSQATRTAVRVDGVSISLGEGSAAITGMTVSNPAGYELPNAFSLGQVRAGIDLESLQEEPYVINEIAVLSPQVFVEINKDNRTNLNELKNNLLPGKPAAAPSEPAKAETSSDAGPRLILRKVQFEGGKILARVAALDNKEFELDLPALNMSNLGGSKGATATELAREIVSRLTDSATQVVKQKIIDGKLAEIKAEAREKIDAEKAKIEQKIDAKKEEQKQEAKDKLKDLFGN